MLWKILVIVLIILLILILVGALGFGTYVMTGKRQTYEEAWEWQSTHYDTSFYETLQKTDYEIASYDGYVLHAQFLKNPVDTDKYMILTHGFTDNHYGSLKYAKMYLDFGFNLVIYDLRGHGANKRTFVTYAIRESRDVMAVVADTRRRYGNIRVLGLHGESLGAASTAMCMKYKPQVNFGVCDCGFADIENVIKGSVESMHLPGFCYYLAALGAILRYHYSFGKMRPIDALGDNTVPMLFIHGDADQLIPYQNSERMAAKTAGYSEVRLIPGATHAESVLKDTTAYREYVEAFLKKIEVL
jgi:pimeloyl-ACP methyl ester carboxylesterase